MAQRGHQGSAGWFGFLVCWFLRLDVSSQGSGDPLLFVFGFKRFYWMQEQQHFCTLYLVMTALESGKGPSIGLQLFLPRSWRVWVRRTHTTALG